MTARRESPPPTQSETWDETADKAAFVKLASVGERFTPLFGLEEADHPESLLFDVTGSTHLFGGEQATVDAVEAEFLRLGFRVQVALAPTVGAAWAVSHFLAKPKRATVVTAVDLSACLAPLPIHALRLPPPMIAVLHELGIQSVGQLERFPRESLPSRFGPSLLHRLDQALGRQDELISCVHPVVGQSNQEACFFGRVLYFTSGSNATMSSIPHLRSVTPAFIAGVIRSDWCIRQKL